MVQVPRCWLVTVAAAGTFIEAYTAVAAGAAAFIQAGNSVVEPKSTLLQLLDVQVVTPLCLLTRSSSDPLTLHWQL